MLKYFSTTTPKNQVFFYKITHYKLGIDKDSNFVDNIIGNLCIVSI